MFRQVCEREEGRKGKEEEEAKKKDSADKVAPPNAVNERRRV